MDMEKIVNLSVSVLLVLWGCALGGSPSVQIGRYPKEKKTNKTELAEKQRLST